MRAQDVRVLAILVATNGEEWLPECIRSLQAQTHTNLDVVAVDNACTDSSGRLLAKAFGGNAIVLDRRVGYGRACAAALKVLSERGAEADAFVFVHDDAELDPNAVAMMVDVMLADESIGIVGGKVLEWDDPALLQEVGMSTDRYGRLFGTLERGELDHGQHDGTREVLFCTTTALLVRREVVERVGLFDPRYVAMRDDLDLCWRARLAGFRTVVTTDARARHVSAAARGRRDGPVSGAARYFSERNRISTLLKNYSVARLAIVLPVLLLHSIAGAALYFVRGRRGVARQIIGALEWNIVHAPSTLRARARGRHHRVATDGDVIKFMVRGAPRLRGYVERVLESVVGEPVRGIEETEIGGPVETHQRRTLGASVRNHPVGASLLALLVVYLVGARALYGPGPIAGSGLLPFPSGTGTFFREFGSGWRSSGAAGAHPPGLGTLLLGLLSLIGVGSTWIASRILILSLLPLAAGLAYRTAGRLGLGRNARLVAALTYGLSPLALSDFGAGRLSDLVLLAAAPGLVLAILTASGATGDPAEGVPEQPAWRSLAAGAAGLAIAGALSPYALPFTAGAAVAIALVAPLSGARPVAVLRAGGIITGGALLLLFPWSLELLRPGTPLREGGFTAAAEMLDVVRLAPAGSPIGHLAWAVPIGAMAGMWLARGRRTRFVVTFAGIAFVSIAAAYGSGHLPQIAPRAGLPLSGAALAFAMLAAAGVDAIVSELRERTFGAGHVAVGASGAFLAVAVLAGTMWFARGDFPSLVRSGDLMPAFIPADVAVAGDFRVLWLGAAPEGGARDEIALDLTGPSGETMLSFAVRRTGAADSYLLRAAAAILGGQSDQGGRLLAPLAVRHVIMRPDASRAVQAALERQTDLRFRQRFRGARVFDNLAWLPLAAPLAGGGWVPASTSPNPFAAALSVDVSGEPLPGLARRGPARFSGRISPATTTVLLGESFDHRWRLFVEGEAIEPRRAFGFATAFDIPAGTLSDEASSGAARPAGSPSPNRGGTSGDGVGAATLVVWRGQSPTRLLLLVQLALWVILAAWWSGRRALERGER